VTIYSLEEAAWCRQQVKEMDRYMDIEKALLIADKLDDEGVISTSALAIRCLAKEYRELKDYKEKMDYALVGHNLELLRNRKGNLREGNLK